MYLKLIKNPRVGQKDFLYHGERGVYLWSEVGAVIEVNDVDGSDIIKKWSSCIKTCDGLGTVSEGGLNPENKMMKSPANKSVAAAEEEDAVSKAAKTTKKSSDAASKAAALMADED